MTQRRDLRQVDRLADAIKVRLMEHADKECWSTEMTLAQCMQVAETELEERDDAYQEFMYEGFMKGERRASRSEVGDHYHHEVLDSIVGLFFEWNKIEEYKNNG